MDGSRINRKLRSTNVIDVLSDLFILRGMLGHIRADSGPEFVAKAVRDWITAIGARTASTSQVSASSSSTSPSLSR